jgi:drug/metabolite transporter (DMT)-like permease
MNETILRRMAKPLMVLATIIWGSSFFILKDTLDQVPAMFILAVRFSIGAVVIALVAGKNWRSFDRGYLVGGVIMGTMLFCGYVAQTFGLMDTTPGKNAFLTSVYCMIVPFVYWFTDGRRPDRYNLLAAVFCVAGIGLLSWDGGFYLSRGDLLTLVCGVFFALHIVSVTYFSKGRNIFMLTAVQFSVAALLSWIFCPLQGFPQGGIPVSFWIPILYLGIFATAGALSFQNIGQKYTNPSAAAVLLSLEAPFGVLFSMLFHKERPTYTMMLGFVLIFLALICSETKLSFLPWKKASIQEESAECNMSDL